jgi:uncharacterized protein YjbJ (UPF0337 family)
MVVALHVAAVSLAVSVVTEALGADGAAHLARLVARWMFWLFLGVSVLSVWPVILELRPGSLSARSWLRFGKGRAMDWDRISGNWKQFKGRLKEQWGKLTDDDIAQLDGSREQLEGKIQERYGYGKDQVRQEIDNWSRRIG